MLFCKKCGRQGFELQTHFYQNVLFIGGDIFSEVMVICFHLKHVSLGFDISSFHNGLKHLCSSKPVSILRATL